MKAFDAFEWGETEDDSKIEDVLAKFDEYCEPRTQVTYERYRFNNRNQEPGESIASYLTELRTIAKNCQHESITSDDNNRFKKTHQKREVSRHLCGRSGTKNPKKNCLAFGQKCHRCGNLNHYQSLCRTKLVAPVGEEHSEEDESYEICTVDEDSRPSVNTAFIDICQH